MDEIAAASSKVLKKEGDKVLQYSTTEGYRPLREYIAKNYSRKGLKVQAEEILITNGSQQCLDLIGKIFVNKSDGVLLEQPTYLAAIQSFSLFEPQFKSVPLLKDGVDTEYLQKTLLKDDIKLFYAVTNFQNPTGITYSKNKRKEMAEILESHNTVLVEDNPYGDIRFMGEDLAPVKSYIPESVLFGSFSKIISPGMRLGWIVAPEEMMDKLIIVKQASDLHSNYFAQRVVYQYLQDNDVENHIQKIRKLYKDAKGSDGGCYRRSIPSGSGIH